MKAKEYQKRKGENFAQWCLRIADMCQGRSFQDVHAMISEVSKTSYIEGVLTERKVSEKFRKQRIITLIKRIIRSYDLPIF